MTDLFSLQGKTALVTGGSRGIGLMIARGYVEAGVTTYISSRKAAVCDEVAAELSEIGSCISVPADLGDDAEVARLAAEVTERTGGVLDILVNNAGAVWGAPIAEFSIAAWDKVVDLNLKTVFFLTQGLLPALTKAGTSQDPSRVINIGSVDGLHAPGGKQWEYETYSYSAAKAGVHHLTRTLAARLGPEHVTVNAIAPGPFATKMMQHTLAAHGDEIAASSPLGRIGQDQDMAGAAIFLASPAASYITGVVLPVDGGMVTTL